MPFAPASALEVSDADRREAGKWKKSTVDAYGNVFQMTEPNPAGGNFTTSYSDTSANQLSLVSMTRGNVTENRTFVYTGADLTSATKCHLETSPEGCHHLRQLVEHRSRVCSILAGLQWKSA